MVEEKKVKQGDIYLTGNELVRKLGIKKGVIYQLYNEKKIRYIFKEIPRCNQLCSIIHFNLDDIRENIKKDLCEK